MPLTPDNMSGAELFEHYARPQGDATRRVERTVLGHEVGLNGYTTFAQAQALSDVVGVQPGDGLLDIGCGYGWPGVQIARRHACDSVFTDVPLDALRVAKANVGGGAVRGRTAVVAADGRSLPFCGTSFDAIVHADVFC